AWAPFFVADGPVLEWKPEIVELQPGGTLGITQGPYQLTIRGEDGTPQVRKGTFTSIWRREEGGGWRIIFDSGCPCQPGD
ncbi:MAG: nuclear transport factor 2 family protein, partial [Acidobacteriota bacterium]